MAHPGGLRAGVLWSARVIGHITHGDRIGSTDCWRDSLDGLETGVFILKFSSSSTCWIVLSCLRFSPRQSWYNIFFSSEAILSLLQYLASHLNTCISLYPSHKCPHATNASISHLECSTDDDDALIFFLDRGASESGHQFLEWLVK